MRIEPSARVKWRNATPLQVRIERVTRVVAIVVAFLSTFTFIIKIMFL